ncbi:MAG: hypothetical protein ACM3U2_08485 [Deltaproteobacteria bacterium]
MENKSPGAAVAVERLLSAVLLTSFFLPAIYFGILMLVGSGESRSAAMLIWIASALIPISVVSTSKQSVLAKFGQVLLAAGVWIVIQLVTAVVFGFIALTQSGLSGI